MKKTTIILILVALVQSIALSVFILRGVLFTPGQMESIDIIWTYYSNVLRSSAHTFNPALSGDNSMFLSVFVYSPIAFIFNTEISQKIYYFLIFFLINFISFGVIYSFLRKRDNNQLSLYVGATIGSLIYTINPSIVPQFFHYSFLWGYMLLPLVFHFIQKMINSVALKGALRNALVLAVLFPFMAEARAMFMCSIVVVFLLVWNVIYHFNQHSVFAYIKKVSIAFVLMIFLSVLISSFWLMPYIEVRPVAYWAITSTNTIISNSPSVLSVISATSYPQPFFYPDGGFSIIWITAIIVPILASLALLKKSKDKTIQSLSMLLLLSIFIAKGTSEPFGGLYIWFSSVLPKAIGLQSLFETILKYPGYFVGITCLAYAFLCGFFISYVFSKYFVNNHLAAKTARPSASLWLFGKARKKLFALALVCLVVLSVGITSYPLMTGNMNGAITPVQLPSQYVNMNKFLDTASGNFRTVFYPESASMIWANQFTNKPEYITSSRPILSYGWGTVPSPNMGVFGNLVYDALLSNGSQNMGNLFSLANVRYVIFHNDTYDWASYQSIYTNLIAQNDLLCNFNESNLYLFRNTGDSRFLYALNRTVFVVGGLDSLITLSDYSNVSLNNNAWIFLEQYPMDFVRLNTIFHLQENNTILFYGNKNFDDLLMDTLCQNYSISPVNYLTQTYPITAWSKETYSDYYWSQAILKKFDGGNKYDFDLNKGIIIPETQQATLNFTTFLPISDNYEGWLRVLQNPQGGNVSMSIDGNQVGVINTQTNTLEGFKWLSLGNISLGSGKHDVSITSENGFNPLNLISLLPLSAKHSCTQQLNDLMRQSNVVTLSTNGALSGDVFGSAQKLPFIVSYTEVNPTKFVVNINSSSPFMLVFSEPYNGLWTAGVAGKIFSSIPISGMMNGFWVNRTGQFSIIVEYTPETLFAKGVLVTISTASVVVLFYILTSSSVQRLILKRRKGLF